MSYPNPMSELMAARRAAVEAVIPELSPAGAAFARLLLARGGFAEAAIAAYEDAIDAHGPGLAAELAARWAIYGRLMWRHWRMPHYVAAPLCDVLRMGRAEMETVGWLRSLTDPAVPLMTATSLALIVWRALQSPPPPELVVRRGRFSAPGRESWSESGAVC